jgi:phosphate transport system permease protein
MTTDQHQSAGLRARRFRPAERATLLLLAVAATLSLFVTVGIVVTLLEEGADFWRSESISGFLFGTEWFPVDGVYGVLPLLTASLLIAFIAGLVAVPIGLGSAIYLSEYAPERVRQIVKPILELLAGMPTIVLGFFALQTLTPALWDVGVIPDGQIYNALAAGIVVGMLIVPLIASLSEDAMRAVPTAMREGAYGLGATRRVVSTRVVFPAALSGIMASIVLGLSRAVGETMAVTLAAGAQPNLTLDPTEPTQTITAAIVQIAKGEAQRGSTQYASIFAIATVLFVVTLLINIASIALVRRFRTVYT